MVSLGAAGILEDFWSGMGGGFVCIGILQMIRRARYRTDPAYKEKVDIQTSDERNLFIMNRAWSVAGRLYLCIASIAIIVLAALGQREHISSIGASVGVLIVLYWGCYFYIRKKY